MNLLDAIISTVNNVLRSVDEEYFYEMSDGEFRKWNEELAMRLRETLEEAFWK